MTTQFYQQGGAGLGVSLNLPVVLNRAPTTSDTVSAQGNPYQQGQVWIYINNNNYTDATVYNFVGGGIWVQVGGTGSQISTLTGNSGGAVGPASGNVNILGAGSIAVTGDPATNTLTISVSAGGQAFTVITVDTVMTTNKGYIVNKAGSAATMTLPAVSVVGDILIIDGLSANGWIVAQAAGQSINMNSVSTTVGVGGSLASSARYNAINLRCVVANTTWNVESSEGTLTVT